MIKKIISNILNFCLLSFLMLVFVSCAGEMYSPSYGVGVSGEQTEVGVYVTSPGEGEVSVKFDGKNWIISGIRPEFFPETNLKEAESLVEEGKVNVKDVLGATPLHWASMRGYVDTVTLLLANGADVNAQDKIGDTPLHGAVRLKDSTTVKLLVQHGADVNLVDALGETPLHDAIQKGRSMETMKFLIDRTDLSIADKRGYTPLHVAQKENRHEIIEYINARK